MVVPPHLLHLSLFFLIPLLIQQTAAASPHPLSTDSRWIVDGAGQRVKLACVNWVSHLEAIVVEGLSKQPLDHISKGIAEMGFNCVRLTWPLFLVTNASLASLTVRRSFLGLGLVESAAAIEVNNPGLIDLPLIQAFKAVVLNLASNNVMVILDNQISKPGWCCSRYDGNGFFGDKYFNPEEWIQGLTLMATMFYDSTHVVGMSLRNELRGPWQNVIDWYRYMQRGAEAVHAANPNVLVIFSGLDYDKDLSFLSKKKVDLTFSRKLVYELHWYGFSDGGDWENGNPNEVCGNVVGNMTRKGYFLLEEGWPLFLSEFGVDQRGTNVPDNRYLSCMLGVAAELDLDWALWGLQGSYYLREGILGYDETYGLLGYDWCRVRNSNFLRRISALQPPFQGPGLSTNSYYKIIFHPLTGLCILRKSLPQPLQLGPCAESEAWSYTTQNSLVLKGPELCILAEGVDNPAKLGDFCNYSNSTWNMISHSKMHLASVLANNGNTVCLDVGPNRTIVTASCKCLSGEEKDCDPESQWFKIVSSNRNLVNQNVLSSFSPKDKGGSHTKVWKPVCSGIHLGGQVLHAPET